MNTTDTKVTLEPVAQDQLPVLQNLFELYVYDFSEHVPLELKPTGRFDIPVGDWWTTDGHRAFFVRCDDKLCGFALVVRGSRTTRATDVMDVAEFFVLRGARRRRIGERAANALFDAFPVPWEIRTRRTNVAAKRFWSRVVETRTGAPATSTEYRIDGVVWDVLRVEASKRTVNQLAPS